MQEQLYALFKFSSANQNFFCVVRLLVCADDPQLEEFLKVMQPRSKSAIWSNDDSLPASAKPVGALIGKRGRVKPSKMSDTDEEDDTDFQDLTEAAPAQDLVKGEPCMATFKKTLAGKYQEKTQSSCRDLEYLKSRMRQEGANEDDEDAVKEASDLNGSSAEERQVPSDIKPRKC